MDKDTFELHPMNTKSLKLENRSFILPMMPFKSTAKDMENTKKGTRFLTMNFKDTWTQHMARGSLTLLRWSIQKWRQFLLMQSKRPIYNSILIILSTISKYLVLISWSIQATMFGWLRSTQILVLSSVVSCLLVLFQQWFSNHLD